MNSAVELLNRSDSGSMAVNRDDSVLRYTLVSKQYDPVEKGRRKFMMNYIYRIKLITILVVA